MRQSCQILSLFFIDDMGYADIGPFGADAYSTPHLDKMAADGMRFTDFQVSSAVCSASRSALVTGCYHARIGIHGALGPAATHGIHEAELTGIASALLRDASINVVTCSGDRVVVFSGA